MNAPNNENSQAGVGFPNVDQLIQKTRRYEFADGLRDLQLAGVVALVGGLAALTYLPEGIRVYMQWTIWFNENWGRLATYLPMLLFLLAMLLLMAGSVRAIRSVRRRWLWRGTGMAEPRTWGMSRPATIAAALIMLISLIGGVLLWMRGVVEADFALRMIWTASGWALGVELYLMGRTLDLPRYRWIGGLGGLASTVILFRPLTFGASALAFAVGWSVVLATSGSVTLYLVYRQGREADADG